MAELYSKSEANELVVETPQPAVVETLSLDTINASLVDAQARVTSTEALLMQFKDEVTRLEKLVSKCKELGIKANK